MIPTLLICTQFVCYAISVERVGPSYAECEAKMVNVELYITDMKQTNKLPHDAFIKQRECRAVGG